MRVLDDLRAELAEKIARIAELEAELADCRRVSQERWDAIGRLAPAAKRLRSERDELRAKLRGLSGPADSD